MWQRLAAAFLIALAIGLASTVPVATEGPTAGTKQAPEAGGDPRFGAVEAFRAPAAAAAAGVRWQRVLFWWYGLQPNGPDDWNQAYFPDSILEAELAAGRRIVGCLINPPRWANGTGRPVDPPQNLYLPYDSPDNYWGQFVRRIVARYKGRIDDWIIGNEPDVWDAANSGYTWNGTVADYYQFLKVAYQAAKETNPKATIVTAGMTYWWDKEHGREQYFDRMLDVARSDPTAAANNWYFDAAALQLYNDPQALFDVPQLFRQIMADHGMRPKPIWITETNVAPWDDPGDPLTRERFRATLDEQAAYVIQAFAYALAGDVERIAIYKMSDSPGLPLGVERFGLARSDGIARPALQAYQVVSTYLAGTRGGAVKRQGDVVRVVLERDADVVTVVWNAGPRAITARVAALAPRALLVDQRGAGREISPEGSYFTLSLPPATANTVPGSPGEYRIGGPPFLLVERRGANNSASQLPVPPVDTRGAANWTDETTGYTISGEWLAASRAMGGLENLGHPLSEVTADPVFGGQTVQFFQRAVLEYHPENPPAYRIQRRLLADLLHPGADAPVGLDAAPPGPYRYYPVTPGKPTGLGHFVADFTRGGEPVYFKEYFDRHGGVDAFGYPKEEPKLRNGRWTQHFQAAVFEYHPEHDRDGFVPGTSVQHRDFRVQLALLGEEYLRANEIHLK